MFDKMYSFSTVGTPVRLKVPLLDWRYPFTTEGTMFDWRYPCSTESAPVRLKVPIYDWKCPRSTVPTFYWKYLCSTEGIPVRFSVVTPTLFSGLFRDFFGKTYTAFRYLQAISVTYRSSPLLTGHLRYLQASCSTPGQLLYLQVSFVTYRLASLLTG
jgi:hypothetical protein